MEVNIVTVPKWQRTRRCHLKGNSTAGGWEGSPVRGPACLQITVPQGDAFLRGYLSFSPALRLYNLPKYEFSITFKNFHWEGRGLQNSNMKFTCNKNCWNEQQTVLTPNQMSGNVSEFFSLIYCFSFVLNNSVAGEEENEYLPRKIEKGWRRFKTIALRQIYFSKFDGLICRLKENANKNEFIYNGEISENIWIL